MNGWAWAHEKGGRGAGAGAVGAAGGLAALKRKLVYLDGKVVPRPKNELPDGTAASNFYLFLSLGVWGLGVGFGVVV